jgi:hypothetical protein
MRKLLLGLVAVLTVAAPVALIAAPANADPGSPKCMTLREWRKVKEGQSQAEVKRITGITGKKSRTSHYSDGTIDFSVEYSQCNRQGRPSGYTTSLYFATEVTYGAYVWDPYNDYVCDYNYDYCHWVGANVWDEYEPNGVTRTPEVTYKGMFY